MKRELISIIIVVIVLGLGYWWWEESFDYYEYEFADFKVEVITQLQTDVTTLGEDDAQQLSAIISQLQQTDDEDVFFTVLDSIPPEIDAQLP